MDRYKFFTVEDDSRFSMPVIRAYERELPLVARVGAPSFEAAREYLRADLSQLAKTGSAEAQKAAKALLPRFDDLYRVPKETPSVLLHRAHSGLRSLFEKHKSTGAPSVFISDNLSVEVGGGNDPGRIDVLLRPFGGVSFAFTEEDINYLQGILREVGLEGPFYPRSVCACSLSLRIPVGQLARVPPEFMTHWLHSRSR